jgi:hypothetical protein
MSSSKMTPPALAAYKVYRDLGTGRTLRVAAELLGKSKSLLDKWSRKYGWQKRCSEHDYQQLRGKLGEREVAIETTRQTIIDILPEAAGVLVDVMRDDRTVPVLDRHGKQQLDAEGRVMSRPLVKPSTRVVCAKTLLGIGGLVEVKRTEHIDRSAEQLDQAAQVIDSLGVEELEVVMKMLDQAESKRGDDGA